MSATRITKPQGYILVHMLANNGISYDDEWNVSMRSLRRKGMVTFHRAAKYGKNHWTLTEAGSAEAEKRQ